MKSVTAVISIPEILTRGLQISPLQLAQAQKVLKTLDQGGSEDSLDEVGRGRDALCVSKPQCFFDTAIVSEHWREPVGGGDAH